MYKIRQAAARSGVPAPLLRAWERRYGVVRPVRTQNGYRLYDDVAIAHLRTMRGLIDSGWSPSAAAEAILDGRIPIEVQPTLAATAIVDGAATAPAQAGTGALPGSPVSAELADRFVAAARDLDANGVEDVLDDLFARGSFERVADDLLFPALRRLGDAWASGGVSVAGEHLASGAVLRRLALALEAAARATRARPRILVGLPPGARHELGALAFAVAARRAGLPVTYLGADLPVDDWVTAAAEADAAVVGVVIRRDRKPARDVVRALRAARPGITLAFGGEAAPVEPDVVLLPPDLPAAVARLDRVLRPSST